MDENKNAGDEYSPREMRLIGERDAALTRAETAEAEVSRLKTLLGVQPTRAADVVAAELARDEAHTGRCRTAQMLRDLIEDVESDCATDQPLMEALKDIAEEAFTAMKEAPGIPMRLPCPSCGEIHVDVAFATKPHHTHACQHCGMVWRPSVLNTVGVFFLPGFKDPPTAEEVPGG